MLCYIMLCSAILYYTIPCYTIPHHAISYPLAQWSIVQQESRVVDLCIGHPLPFTSHPTAWVLHAQTQSFNSEPGTLLVLLSAHVVEKIIPMSYLCGALLFPPWPGRLFSMQMWLANVTAQQGRFRVFAFAGVALALQLGENQIIEPLIFPK